LEFSVSSSSDLRIASRFARGAQLASAVVIAIGVAALVGWVADIPVLQRVHPTLASMKVNTALALIALALALRFSIRRAEAPASRALAAGVIVVAVATLSEYAFGIDLGIDELLVRDAGTSVAPGRMSPATGTCLVLFGVAVLWLEKRWAEWIAIAVALFAHVALLGHLYGVRDLYAIGPYTSIALHTCVALCVLALGILLARSQRGLMSVVASASPGGILARRLLPAAFVLPAVLALLRQWGQGAGFYGTGFGRAMLVASNTVVFVALIWWTAAAIARADRARRAAADAVRESEADLAITLESIGDAVIATDELGRIKRMNAVAERLTGWPIAEARGRPLTDVFRIANEDTGAPVDDAVDRVLREGVVIGLANHTVLTARDGIARPIANSAAPIRNAQGVTSGVVVVFQDHSAERVAERRLRDSEARKTAILESALDAIISIDAEGNILELNSAAEAMFRRTRDQVVGMPLGRLIPPTAHDAHNRRLLRLSSGDSSMIGNRNDVTAFRADGSEFPVEISITHVEHADPPRFTVLLRDVTEPQRARAEIMRSHDRLRALAGVSDAFAKVATAYQPLLDTIARTIADLVGDGCLVTLVSDDGARLASTSYAHRDPVFERDHREDIAQFGVTLADSNSITATVARTGRPTRGDIDPDTLAARSEEALRPLVMRLEIHGYAVVPIRARSTVIGTLAVMRNQAGRSYTDEDVTLLQDLADRAGLAIENARLYAQLEHRVRARTAELEASNKDLEAFSYSVAHDLRAPLRAISGFSHALDEDHAERLDPDGRSYVAQIRTATTRMSQLIDDLLQLSKISRTELRRIQVDVSELARAVVARLRAAQPEREVEVVIEPGLAASADPRLLEVVLTNLLGNAWKFTGKREQPRIELAAQPGELPAVYLVRDNGAGFAPEHTGRLFSAFQRLHSEREFEGTGIGLATVLRIVHSHGGRIWAEAEVDKGATFYFTLEPAEAG
jgi:PAS domain S-box-containing protein